MGKIYKDTPLMELTLRRYEKPSGLEERELIRKFCLSIGLLQPGDSRDIIVDIVHVLLLARKKQEALASEEIRDRIITMKDGKGDGKKEGRESKKLNGVAASNIRRQVKRLRDLQLVEKVKTKYRIAEFLPVQEIYKERISQFLLPPIVSRVEEYFKAIDEKF